MTSFTNIESNTYPDKEFPENARKLRGFLWRGDEQIKSKDDIFPDDEKILHEKILKKSKIESKIENVPMKIRKETKRYNEKKIVRKKIVK